MSADQTARDPQGRRVTPSAFSPSFPMSAAGAEPVLVVDLGTTTSSAILLADGDRHLLKEPGTGRDWRPTSVYHDGGRIFVGTDAERRKSHNPSAYRTEFKPEIGSDDPMVLSGAQYTAEDLAVEVLAVFREESARFGVVPARLLVTVPAGTDGRRRDAMLSAGARAGFTDVELLAEPVAAAFAPAVGACWSPGAIVLVYDLGGGTFDAALVRVGEHAHEVVQTAGLVDGHAGRNVDAAIVRDLRPAADAWIGAAPDRAAQRARLDQWTLAAAIKLKLGLTAQGVASADIALEIPAQRMDLERLTQIAEPLLAGTVACCLSLLSAADLSLNDVDGVLLVGGSTQMPVVKPYLERHLGRPIFPATDPVLAVVEGAARWAGGIPSRRGRCDPPSDSVLPLRWTLPDDRRATLVRWFVEPGDVFSADEILARVRLADNTLYDLQAHTGAQVVRLHVRHGESLHSGDWILTTLRPPKPEELFATPRLRTHWQCGDVTAMEFRPNGRCLAIACRDAADESTLLVVDPESGDEVTRTSVHGRIHAVAWSPDGQHLAYGRSGDRDDDQTVTIVDGLASPGGAAVARQLAEFPGAVADVAYLPEGRHLAVACATGSLWLIDVATGSTQMAAKLPGRPEAMAVHPDGRRIAVGYRGDSEGSFHLINIEGGEAPEPLAFPAPVRSLAFSPDGWWLAAAGGTDDEKGFLTFYDTASWRKTVWLASTRTEASPMPRGAKMLVDTAAQFSLVALAAKMYLDKSGDSADDKPRPWNIGAVRAIDLSPNGILLAFATVDGEVWAVRTDDGRTACATRYGGPPAAVGFSADGHRLAVAGADGVRLWELTDTQEARGRGGIPPESPRVRTG
jgi:WD40 repeat protein/actin-like ATPase involved in cell morphogenesis